VPFGRKQVSQTPQWRSVSNLDTGLISVLLALPTFPASVREAPGPPTLVLATAQPAFTWPGFGAPLPEIRSPAASAGVRANGETMSQPPSTPQRLWRPPFRGHRPDVVGHFPQPRAAAHPLIAVGTGGLRPPSWREPDRHSNVLNLAILLPPRRHLAGLPAFNRNRFTTRTRLGHYQRITHSYGGIVCKYPNQLRQADRPTIPTIQ
jgi:hypothetical protein